MEREEKARKSFTKQKVDYFGRSVDAAYLAEASRRYRIARMGGAPAASAAPAPVSADVAAVRYQPDLVSCLLHIMNQSMWELRPNLL